MRLLFLHLSMNKWLPPHFYMMHKYTRNWECVFSLYEGFNNASLTYYYGDCVLIGDTTNTMLSGRKLLNRDHLLKL